MVIICAKKEGVCWFLIDADDNAGMRRVKFARNYGGAIINYWSGGGGGRGGLVNFGGGLRYFGLPFRKAKNFWARI